MRLDREVCADPRKVMEKARTVTSEVSPKPSWRTASRRFAKRCKRNLLRATHRLPMEGIAPSVWFFQHRASLLPAVGAAGRVSSAVEGVLEGVRPTQRHRLELAEFGRDDDQGVPRGGKRQGKTRRIVANWGSSVLSSPIVEAYRWASRSPARMFTIRNWWPSLSLSYRCHAPAPGAAADSTCAWTKDIAAHRSSVLRNGAAMYCTCPSATESRPLVARDAVRDDGSSNAHTVGPIEPDDSSYAGKRRPSIIWDSYIYSSPTPH